MKNLWAPWRMTYIEGDDASMVRDPSCLFCRLPKESADRDNLILLRRSDVFVIMNRYPYSNGHLMVVPYAHEKDLSLLQPAVHQALFATATEMTKLLAKTVNAEGFNVGLNLGRCAGAGIADHLHVHVVPRWSGDTNFMPVLAEAKVISEHLSATYDKLQSCLKSESP